MILDNWRQKRTLWTKSWDLHYAFIYSKTRFLLLPETRPLSSHLTKWYCMQSLQQNPGRCPLGSPLSLLVIVSVQSYLFHVCGCFSLSSSSSTTVLLEFPHLLPDPVALKLWCNQNLKCLLKHRFGSTSRVYDSVGLEGANELKFLSNS